VAVRRRRVVDDLPFVDGRRRRRSLVDQIELA
jgi:hypothetical protein